MICTTFCMLCMAPSVERVNLTKHHGVCENCSIPDEPFGKCIHCRSIVPILIQKPSEPKTDSLKLEFRECVNCNLISTDFYEFEECGHRLCSECNKGSCPICSYQSQYSTINPKKILVEVENPKFNHLSRSAKVNPMLSFDGNFSDSPNSKRLFATISVKNKNDEMTEIFENFTILENDPENLEHSSKKLDLEPTHLKIKKSWLWKVLHHCFSKCKRKPLQHN